MHRQRACFVIAAAAALLLSAVATSAAAPAVGASPAPHPGLRPALQIVGPARLHAGTPTLLRLVARDAPSLAAFEVALHYDDSALVINRVIWAPTMPSGAALHGLQTAEATDRTELGAWSCTGPACGAHTTSSPGWLGEIEVVAQHTGRYDLRLDGTELVAPNGTTLAPSEAIRSGGATPHMALDALAEGAPSTRDAEGLAAQWLAGAQHGNECTHDAYADVDGDGCLTMADVQSVAGHATAPDPTSPKAGATPSTVTTFVVNSTGDGSDATNNGVCSTSTPGVCTLRAALQEANQAANAVEIDFNIPGSGVQKIAPQSLLPTLTNTNGITINGFTQPGSSANTDPLVDNAVYGIELAGKGPGSINGFVVASSHNVFEGLDMHGFAVDIAMNTSNSNFNTIVGSMFGLTPTGNLDPTYKDFTDASCLVMQNGANHNEIGAPGNGNRNVVSGCDFKGIATYNWPTNWNTIQNNIVGLDPTGTQRRATKSHGIDVTRGSEHTAIGGTGTEEGNLVSGNGQAGIEVAHEPATEFNSVIGNRVGTDPTGNTAPSYAGNGYWGIHLEGHGDCGSAVCPPDQSNETVEYNVVVGNGRGGVMVDKGTHDSIIAFNKIGVTANGTAGGNHLFGLNLNSGATHITISNNEIANNDVGIEIQPDTVLAPNHVLMTTNDDTITQNSIYNNNLTGTPALGIDLAPYTKVNTAANASPYVNDAIIAPTLSNAQPTSITASTCASCTVEVFVADSAAGVWGSGRTYLASGTADSTGVAAIALPGGAAGNVVTATSTNPDGSTSEFAKNVLVPTSGNGNNPPTARFTPSCNQLACSFDGSASSDSDGTVEAYSWDFGDGATGTGRRVNHTYAHSGTYDVRLTVTDDGGATGSTLLAIAPAKLPPLPAFAWRCVQRACTFDGHLSVDNDSAITTYLWNFGDSATASGAQTQHTYGSSGPRSVTLTIADASGATAHVVAPIDVNGFTNVGNSTFTFASHYTVRGVYRPVTGDFNGDGKTDILWYAPGAAPDPIWYGTATGFRNGGTLAISGIYLPLVGHFNSDGTDDILWYAPGSSTDHLWYGSASGFDPAPDPVVNGLYEPAVDDFNGDGYTDIVWGWPTATTQPVWFGGTNGFTKSSITLPATGQPLVGDFNGDHYDDIFWYAGGTGADRLWVGSPSGLLRAAIAPSVHHSYSPVVGDFNGDGNTDILWYAPGPDTDSVWYGSAAGLQAGPHVSVNGFYEPLGGDFNGDGKGDVFWYGPSILPDSAWQGN